MEGDKVERFNLISPPVQVCRFDVTEPLDSEFNSFCTYPLTSKVVTLNAGTVKVTIPCLTVAGVSAGLVNSLAEIVHAFTLAALKSFNKNCINDSFLAKSAKDNLLFAFLLYFLRALRELFCFVSLSVFCVFVAVLGFKDSYFESEQLT